MLKYFIAVIFVIFSTICNAQLYVVNANALPNLPVPITNTAAVLAKYKNNTNLYCFGGIDSTLLYSGIHQHCYAYDSATMLWRTLQNLPDTLGKIASSASVIKDTIYIVGGYHVLANGNEISSKRVHRFVPVIDSFISDATAIPLAIDDQGQAVWRDSLLYVISGWSNIASITNVQIFSPNTNTWLAGTSMPNNNFYKSFGSNAVIITDTIYCFGGASAGTNFPNTNYLRKGIINPSNPTQITWSYIAVPTQFKYRGVVTKWKDYLVLAGGSKKTYNYNAQAYDGSGLVATTNSYYLYHTKFGFTIYDTMQFKKINMDSRTVPSDDNQFFYVCGGINDSGKVSATCKQYYLEIIGANSKVHKAEVQYTIYPNPCTAYFTINTNVSYSSVCIVDLNGKICKQFDRQSNQQYAIQDLPKGNYFVQLNTASGWVSRVLVKE